MYNKYVDSIELINFKSFRHLNNFSLRPLNIFLGINGSGKSNFLSFFKFLRKTYLRELQTYVKVNGGADSFLFYGKKVSSNIQCLYIFCEGTTELEFVAKFLPQLLKANNLDTNAAILCSAIK